PTRKRHWLRRSSAWSGRGSSRARCGRSSIAPSRWRKPPRPTPGWKADGTKARSCCCPDACRIQVPVSDPETGACQHRAMLLSEKLAVLADAAKYDASCSSSGGAKRDSRGTGGIGSNEGSGICHAYAPDGRCISLLKILLTN